MGFACTFYYDKPRGQNLARSSVFGANSTGTSVMIQGDRAISGRQVEFNHAMVKKQVTVTETET